MKGSWLVPVAPPAPRPAPRLRLVCIPFAGGDATVFRDWAPGLPREVELLGVEPPGSLRRIMEPPVRSLEAALEGLWNELAELPTLPLALFGSCTGSFLAFELARRLEADGRAPAHLFCSSVWAPQLPSRHAPIHALGDDEFLEALQGLGALPAETLAQPELLEVLTPAARASFEAAETYAMEPGSEVSCALTAISGARDALVSKDELEAWSERTSGGFRSVLLDGGHAIWTECREELLSTLAADLAGPLASGREEVRL
ncbi:MAG: thioesterase domain-containing protein [Planctomycetota bacterium]